jgi:CheY-like chemotaxis protein
LKGIIEWLLRTERLAGDIYRTAAEKFPGDKAFNSFLVELAKDEDIHFRLIKNAEKILLDKKGHPESVVKIDQDIKDKIDTPLKELYVRVRSARRINKKALLKAIVNIEFAELNNIFLYVVNSFPQKGQGTGQTVEIIQSHTERIKSFIKRHYDGQDLPELMGKLPDIGKKKILVIDSHIPTRIFISKMLEEFGKIETATDGQEALKRLSSLFFNVILLDIEMPLMNGIDLYRKATESSPNIADHFIFYSRIITEDIKMLCEVHNIICLKKPFGINQLHEAVRTTLEKK